MKRALGTWIWLAAGIAAAACSDAQGPEVPTAAVRGRHVYQNVCIACHNADPSVDGSLGPALAGSSRELLEAKLVRGEYPPAHQPERPSAAMPKFEYLAGSIDDLVAYLADPGS